MPYTYRIMSIHRPKLSLYEKGLRGLSEDVKSYGAWSAEYKHEDSLFDLSCIPNGEGFRLAGLIACKPIARSGLVHLHLEEDLYDTFDLELPKTSFSFFIDREGTYKLLFKLDDQQFIISDLMLAKPRSF